MSSVAHEGGEPIATFVFQPPRQIRQNPNLSKQKNLLEPDLGKLKTGLWVETIVFNITYVYFLGFPSLVRFVVR